MGKKRPLECAWTDGEFQWRYERAKNRNARNEKQNIRNDKKLRTTKERIHERNDKSMAIIQIEIHRDGKKKSDYQNFVEQYLTV